MASRASVGQSLAGVPPTLGGRFRWTDSAALPTRPTASPAYCDGAAFRWRPAAEGQRSALQHIPAPGGNVVVGEETVLVGRARWRKFERIARDIAAGIPLQMLSTIYLNAFDAWSDEQDDAAAYNDAAPVDQAIACH